MTSDPKSSSDAQTQAHTQPSDEYDALTAEFEQIMNKDWYFEVNDEYGRLQEKIYSLFEKDYLEYHQKKDDPEAKVPNCSTKSQSGHWKTNTKQNR